ncbi:MAG: HlyD family efflux transporter periplasmic adaptor subunit [Ectothiorhodospiraceae bacterium]
MTQTPPEGQPHASATRRFLKALILVGLILGIGAAVFAALWSTRPQVTADPAEERAWPVAAVTVDKGRHRPVLRLQGRVESPRTATLTAAVTADVAEVSAREGDRVAAADRLVSLEDDELRFALAEQQARVDELAAQRRVDEQRMAVDRRQLQRERELLELLEREVERLQTLSRDAFATPAQLESAQQERTRQRLAVAEQQVVVDTAEDRLARVDAQLDQARAARDRAELDRSRARVQAPFQGRIAEVSVAPGDRVSPGTPLVTVFDTAALEIRAGVPSHALPALRRAADEGGVEARARIDGVEASVTLDRFAGQAASDDASVDALFRIEERNEAIALNRFASLQVRLPPVADTVVLPFEALYDGDRVYAVRDGRMRSVTVERVGEVRREDGRRRVLVRAPELAGGDRVVATQIPQAMDGLRVRLTESPES